MRLLPNVSNVATFTTVTSLLTHSRLNLQLSSLLTSSPSLFISTKASLRCPFYSKLFYSHSSLNYQDPPQLLPLPTPPTSKWYKHGSIHRGRRIRQAVVISMVVAGLSIWMVRENFETLSLRVLSLTRTYRSLWTGLLIILDYKLRLEYYFRAFPDYPDNYNERRSKVHLACANRLLSLCKHNGGIYIKAGQHLASLNHALPREYTQTLSVLEDSAPHCKYDEILPVFLDEFNGKTPQELFSLFEHEPMASASLAQVHRAITHDGEEVAVKVQYPFVRKLFRGDLLTMELITKIAHFFFEDLNLTWIVNEFEQNLTSELDFLHEARNSWETSQRFQGKPKFHVPHIRWDLTTSRVLTMEYIHGIKITDVDRLHAVGVDTKRVARTLAEVFGEMIFVHGRIHGDPHPGNILVQIIRPGDGHPLRDCREMTVEELIEKNPSSILTTTPFRRCLYHWFGIPTSSSSTTDYSLVLLDHGLYRTVTPSFRLNFCQLWKSLIFFDEPLLKESSRRLFGCHVLS